MEDLEYPRILLINGQAIGQKSGVGSTLANLFRGWPKDRIAQIVPIKSEPDETICRNNWYLRSPICDPCSGISAKLEFFLRSKRLAAFGYPISSDLLLWVENFKPNLIYSYLEQPHITNLVIKLAKVLDVTIVPHFMDEWNSPPKGFRLSDYWWFVKRAINLNEIIRHSNFGLAISDAMSSEYQIHFRRPFYTFMNSADPDKFSPVKQISEDAHTHIRMVYAGSGSGGLGRWPLIETIGRAVQQLNQNGYQIDFTIFVHTNQLSLHPIHGNGVSIFDFQEEDKLAEFLSKSDVAVLVEGFDKESIKYSRLSFSAKIPIYLMAGCCIFSIGSLLDNSIKYISENNLGVTVCNDSFEAITHKLKELYNNRELLSQCQQRNRQFALKNFTQSTIHKKFVTLLQTAIMNKLS